MWTACVLFSTVWWPAALATPATSDDWFSTPTFLAIPVKGGVVVRNVSPEELTVHMDVPDAANFPDERCEPPFNYTRREPQPNQLVLPVGTSHCIRVKDGATSPLTLRSVEPYHQVHLTAKGVELAPVVPHTLATKNGVALYAPSAKEGSECTAGHLTTTLVSTGGEATTVCLTEYGGFRHATGLMEPGVYSGRLNSDKIRTAAGTAVPVTLTVRRGIVAAMFMITLGVLLGLLLPFLQEAGGRAGRRAAALRQAGMTDDPGYPRVGKYTLFRSGREQHLISTALLSASTDEEFTTDLQGIESFSKVKAAEPVLRARVNALVFPSWTPSGGAAIQQSAIPIVQALEGVLNGHANFLVVTDPPNSTSNPPPQTATSNSPQPAPTNPPQTATSNPPAPTNPGSAQGAPPPRINRLQRRFERIRQWIKQRATRLFGSSEASQAPQLPAVFVNWSQAKALASTFEESIRVATAVQNIDVPHYIKEALKEPASASAQLVRAIYQEGPLTNTEKDLQEYRERLKTLRAAADTPPPPAATGGKFNAFAPTKSRAPAPSQPVIPAPPLATQPAAEEWTAYHRAQSTSWGLLLALSLVIALASGLVELYVGKPWGATPWDGVKAFLWGAGTGVAIVVANSLVKALSGSAVLGALVKRVKV